MFNECLNKPIHDRKMTLNVWQAFILDTNHTQAYRKGKGVGGCTPTDTANKINSAVKCMPYLFLYGTLPVERVLFCDQ